MLYVFGMDGMTRVLIAAGVTHMQRGVAIRDGAGNSFAQ
jgi:hypothetical protein